MDILKPKAYLIYPFILVGSPLLKEFKAKLEGKYEILDPFENVGIGTDAEIAERDIELIRKCDVVIAYLPVEGLQSGIEIGLALSLGKKMIVYVSSKLEGPFINWLKTQQGVEVVTILPQKLSVAPT